MHPVTLKKYQKIKRFGDRAGTLRLIDRAYHLHVSGGVVNAAIERLVERRDIAATPSNSGLPSPITVVTGLSPGSAYLLREGKRGSVEVNRLVTGGHATMAGSDCIAFAEYRPGYPITNIDEHASVGVAKVLKAEGLRGLMVAHKIAVILSLINQPGSCVVRSDRGGLSHRQKMVRVSGMAPKAWTVIHDVVGRSAPAQRRDSAGASTRKVALHKRKAHYAWVPSQRQTKKSVWLDDREAGARGAGWYVRRPMRIVGNDYFGVRCSRRLARTYSESPMSLPMVPKGVIGAAALSAAQRALITDHAKGIRSTLH